MIVGSMVIGNEIDRYLQASLTRLLEVTDKVFVMDESTDGSGELAKEMGCRVYKTKKDDPTFQKDESEYRQFAWDKMGSILRLKETDWILSIDADEYMTGELEGLKTVVKSYREHVCFSLPILEVWNIDPLQIRTDKYWKKNKARRFANYSMNLKFRKTPMGCGSVPHYNKPSLELSSLMTILHFGYAIEEDRQKKYNFYNSRSHCHNEEHIQSIIAKNGALEDCDFEVNMWRGVK